MFYGIAMILVGVSLAFVAFKDYDWFMNNRKARPFVNMLPR